MKKTIFLTITLLGLINFTFAQNFDNASDDLSKNRSRAIFYMKAGGGIHTPMNSSKPALLESKETTGAFSFGFLGGKFTKNTFAAGFEFGGAYSKLVNDDKTIGIGGEYELQTTMFKFLLQYNLTDWFNVQYNIGWGAIMASRPWFVVPAASSANGKILEEYPIEKYNNCFVMGVGFNIKPIKWLSLNINCDYIGATMNFTNVVHSEDKYVTKVYDTDLKLRTYMVTLGLVYHSQY